MCSYMTEIWLLAIWQLANWQFGKPKLAIHNHLCLVFLLAIENNSLAFSCFTTFLLCVFFFGRGLHSQICVGSFPTVVCIYNILIYKVKVLH